MQIFMYLLPPTGRTKGNRAIGEGRWLVSLYGTHGALYDMETDRTEILIRRVRETHHWHVRF